MLDRRNFILFSAAAGVLAGCKQPAPPPPPPPQPDTFLTPQQYAAQSFGMMFCFGMATFENNQNASAYASPLLFNPPALSFNQWLDWAQTAGAEYVVPVFRHHDGFTLWDSEAQPHNVTTSPGFEDRDLLAEFYENATGRGLPVVPYVSIWDKRWEADHSGFTPAQYTAFTKAVLTEVKDRCPNAVGVWTDGWKWHFGNHTTVDWGEVSGHFRSLWPNGLLINNDHEDNLNHTDIVVYEQSDIPEGNTLPSEVVNTILDGGWFRNTNTPVIQTADTIRQLTDRANTRGGPYLLSVGPSPNGLLASDITDVLGAL